MAYTKQTFVDGETTLKAAHLQHIEDGIEAAHKAIDEMPTPDDGSDGGYYTPSVDAETGDLSWTGSEEGMPEVPGANIKGPKGDPYTLTEEDKSAIANSVLASLPTWTGGSY